MNLTNRAGGALVGIAIAAALTTTAGQAVADIPVEASPVATPAGSGSSSGSIQTLGGIWQAIINPLIDSGSVCRVTGTFTCANNHQGA